MAHLPNRARRCIEEFIRARLIVIDAQEIEVTHEALFRHWKPLNKWISDAKDDLGIYRRADEAAKAWDQIGRPRGSLWRSPDIDLLRRYDERNPGTLTDLQKAFLYASRRQQKVGRWVARGIVALIIMLGIVAVGFALDSRGKTSIAQKQTLIAEEQTRQKEAESIRANQLATTAEDQRALAKQERDRAIQFSALMAAGWSSQELENGDAMTALLIAVEALRKVPKDVPDDATKPAVQAAISAYNQLREVRLFKDVQDFALSADELHVVIIDANGILLVRSIGSGQELWRRPIRKDDSPLRLWPTDSNSVRLVWPKGRRIETISLKDGSLLQTSDFGEPSHVDCDDYSPRFKSFVKADQSVSIIDLSDLSVRNLRPPLNTARSARGTRPSAKRPMLSCQLQVQADHISLTTTAADGRSAFWIASRTAQDWKWISAPEFVSARQTKLHPSKAFLASVFIKDDDRSRSSVKFKDLWTGKRDERKLSSVNAASLEFSSKGSFLALNNDNHGVEVFTPNGIQLNWERDVLYENKKAIDFSVLSYFHGHEDWERTDDYGPIIVPGPQGTEDDKDSIFFGVQSGLFFKAFRSEGSEFLSIDGSSIFSFPVSDHVDDFSIGSKGRIIAAKIDGAVVIWTTGAPRPMPDSSWSEVGRIEEAQDRAVVWKLACTVLTRGLTLKQRQKYSLPSAPELKDTSGFPMPPCPATD